MPLAPHRMYLSLMKPFGGTVSDAHDGAEPGCAALFR